MYDRLRSAPCVFKQGLILIQMYAKFLLLTNRIWQNFYGVTGSLTHERIRVDVKLKPVF